jgi:AcrR family transcriptional regulator
MTGPIKDQIDGRRRRSARTRKALIEAYLDLLREYQQPPTAPEIAERAGVSTRSVFERFSDILTLSLAAADYAFEQATAQAAMPNLDADLHTRLKSQVETRAALCEQWLPLWRALLRYQKCIGRAGNSDQTHSCRDGRAPGAGVRTGAVNAV